MNSMPSDSRFAECLQKFKYAFNLVVDFLNHIHRPIVICVMPFVCNSHDAVSFVLFIFIYFSQGEHNEKLKNPSAAELIHSLFTTLAFVSD